MLFHFLIVLWRRRRISFYQVFRLLLSCLQIGNYGKSTPTYLIPLQTMIRSATQHNYISDNNNSSVIVGVGKAYIQRGKTNNTAGLNIPSSRYWHRGSDSLPCKIRLSNGTQFHTVNSKYSMNNSRLWLKFDATMTGWHASSNIKRNYYNCSQNVTLL